jgi:hypothetical protein
MTWQVLSGRPHPSGADSCAKALTAGPAAAAPIPHSPMHSCSSLTLSADCASPNPVARVRPLLPLPAQPD